MPKSIRTPTINKAVVAAAKYAVTQAQNVLAQAQLDVLLQVAITLDLPCVEALTRVRQQVGTVPAPALMALLDTKG